MIDSIIFDLDGVITSTDEYHYLAWKEIANRLNIEFDREFNKRFLGVSRMECVNILLENYNKDVDDDFKKQIAEEKNEFYKTFLNNMTSDFVDDDVKNTLDILKKKNFKLAIGSSSKNTPLILEKIGYSHFFDAVSDGNQIKNSKPDPEVFLLAVKKLNKNVENCLVIGDAEADIIASKKANIKSASIGNASKLKLGDFQLDRLSDILKILEKINKN